MIELVFIILWLAFLGYTIHYCRKVAEKLDYRKDVATAIAIFFTIPAIILYAYYSHTGKPVSKEKRDTNIQYCHKCGNNLDLGSQFCTNCGTKVS